MVTRSGTDVDQVPQFSAYLKNEWIHTSTSTLFLHGMDGDNFTFTFVVVFFGVLTRKLVMGM